MNTAHVCRVRGCEADATTLSTSASGSRPACPKHAEALASRRPWLWDSIDDWFLLDGDLASLGIFTVDRVAVVETSDLASTGQVVRLLSLACSSIVQPTTRHELTILLDGAAIARMRAALDVLEVRSI